MSKANWLSSEVRETFLNFFVQKNHRRLPSASLVPFNDPTLLLVAAGMAPFKAEFAGIAKPVSPRITTCQKCVRADDLEKVGHTSRHHTFFEMLGNFSFGDYFKQESILWAWELLTQHYKLPVKNLWVSVHTDDDEARQIWIKETGISSDRVVRLADNFWGPIGPTGTCGPDSEIYYDRGEAFSCKKPGCKPGCDNKNKDGVDCERYLELWNLVFTMYHKDETGKLHDLPRKNIDTGAGLERISMVLQGKNSPYETDLFQKLMERIPQTKTLRQDQAELARRIIADHTRAAIFMAADGIVPSNDGRGYVLRNFIRRAKAFLYNLGNKDYFGDLGLIQAILETMGAQYPELNQNAQTIQKVIRDEENDFASRTDQLLGVLENEIRSKFSPGSVIPGEILFRYHDELGLRFEFAKVLIESFGYQVDEKGYADEMEKQRTRSRSTRPMTDVMSQGLETHHGSFSPTEFLGYQSTQADAQIIGLLKGKEKIYTLEAGDVGIVILNKTPFYAESGGQVGDTGVLISGEANALVSDTQKNEGDVFLHQVKVKKGSLAEGARVQAALDSERRAQIRKHHTATHLLHAAVQKILGPHAQQAGSFVCDQYLRLDFTHPKGVTPEELLKIETLVNEKIYENMTVNTVVTSQEEAKKQGAVAIFGEKYGENVRMVAVNEFSKELCGGTHVSATGDIGPLLLVKESAIAKGIRRIEAKAGKAAIEFIEELQTLQTRLTDYLKVDSKNLAPQVAALLAERQENEKEIRRLRSELARYKALPLLEKSRRLHDISLIAAEVSIEEKEELRAMAEALRGNLSTGIVFLASVIGGKVSFACGITQDLVKQGFSAVELIKAIAPIVGGGGGGKADFAEAGGKDPTKIKEALLEVEKIMQSKTVHT